jgi:hypothetical protein
MDIMRGVVDGKNIKGLIANVQRLTCKASLSEMPVSLPVP